MYRNIYTVGGNQAMMVKSNGGSGYVKNVLMENFLVRGSAYGLDINQYWSSQSVGEGAGVQLSDFVFKVPHPPLVAEHLTKIHNRTGMVPSPTVSSGPPSSSSAPTAHRAQT